jgi:type IV secretory pathway VirB2 component (pilin)
MRALTLFAIVIMGPAALWTGLALAQAPLASQATRPASQPSPAASPALQAPGASQAAKPQALQAPQTSQASSPSQARYSADALYNLANSYARAGKPGLAVLNYERAALLAPNDADINANLDYVRASAHVPTEPRNRFAHITQVTTPALAAWLGVLGIALVGAGLLAGGIPPRFRWARACSILLGVALMALTVSNAMLLWPRMHEAVVLINQTPARVSPVPMGDTAFVLPEAETVTMTAEHEDFVLIRTRGGQSGWVARANIGAVVVRREAP